ncbi:uncharacterized protein LOC106157819 [Lingula anatina]|uniref:Zinc finger CCCH domain-containing protein 3 n=1 Tax=Lingula anatina TaxID=7574 RepID=A0A1S3HVD8_LINAN|nr:uncharacterized protein LOC106157819 [Lingula anatina]|eukprot:XP_013389024.1 uncharacterized protein LOC106157819 [Lingula anatina]
MDETNALLKEVEYWTKLIHAHKQKGGTQSTYTRDKAFNRNRGNKTWINRNRQIVPPQGGSRENPSVSTAHHPTKSRTVVAPQNTFKSTSFQGNSIARKVNTLGNAFSDKSKPSEKVVISKNVVKNTSHEIEPSERGGAKKQIYNFNTQPGANISNGANSKREVKYSATETVTTGAQTSSQIHSKRTVKLPQTVSNTNPGAYVKETVPAGSAFLKKGKYSLIKKTLSTTAKKTEHGLLYDKSLVDVRPGNAPVNDKISGFSNITFNNQNSGFNYGAVNQKTKSLEDADLIMSDNNANTLNVSCSKPSKRTVVNPKYTWVSGDTRAKRLGNSGKKVEGHTTKHSASKLGHNLNRSLSNSSSGSNSKDSPAQTVARGLVSKYKKINPGYKPIKQLQQPHTGKIHQALFSSKHKNHSSPSISATRDNSPRVSKYKLNRKNEKPSQQEVQHIQGNKSLIVNRSLVVKRSKYSLVKTRVTGGQGSGKKQGQQRKMSKYSWTNTGELIHAHKQKGGTQSTYSTDKAFNRNRGNKTWINRNRQIVPPQGGSIENPSVSTAHHPTKSRTVVAPQNTFKSTSFQGNSIARKVNTLGNAFSDKSKPSEKVVISKNVVKNTSHGSGPSERGGAKKQIYDFNTQPGANISNGANSKREVKYSATETVTTGAQTSSQIHSKRTVKLPQTVSNTNPGAYVKETVPAGSAFLKKGKYSLIKKTLSTTAKKTEHGLLYDKSLVDVRPGNTHVNDKISGFSNITFNNQNSGFNYGAVNQKTKSLEDADLIMSDNNANTLNVSCSKPSKRTVVNPKYTWVSGDTRAKRLGNSGKKVEGHTTKHSASKLGHSLNRSLSNSSSGSNSKDSPAQTVARGLVSKYKKINPGYKPIKQLQQPHTGKIHQALFSSKHKNHSSPSISASRDNSPRVSKYKLNRKNEKPSQQQVQHIQGNKSFNVNRSLVVKRSKYSLVKTRVTGGQGSGKKQGQQRKMSKYSWTNTGGDDCVVSINNILGRKVKNLSKNRYKFIQAQTFPKLTQRFMYRQLTHGAARSPQKSQLKLDHRHPPKKSSDVASRFQGSQRLVVIGGLVYRSSRTRLNKTSSVDSTTTKQHRNPCIVKRLNTRKMKTITVRGEKFNMDPSGKTLHRIDLNATASPKKGDSRPRKTSVKRVDIGGVTYVQTRPGTLVRAGNSQNRKRASNVLHKSITTAVQCKYKKQRQQYCLFYNRFGKCKRGHKCPFAHDPDKIAICTRFLRGTCKGENCPFSHQVLKEKMPVCSFFLRGVCNKDDCPYLHVNVSRDAAVCEDFLHGYCSLGEKCKKKHTLQCPEFTATGKCPRGKKCKMQHHKRAPYTQDKLGGNIECQHQRAAGAKRKMMEVATVQHSTPIAKPEAESALSGLTASSSTNEDSEDDKDFSFKRRRKKRNVDTPASLPSFISLHSDTSLAEGEEGNMLTTDGEQTEKAPLKIKPRFSDVGLD